ncbi:MAG: hypothetical protein JOZ05_03140, partial [Acetobacteraceae bacterium]|nr:hypothetical protein [Acetobacteraceae bacterium]
ALRRSLAAAVRGVDCALVSGDVSRDAGQVSLRGVVGRGTPEQDLLRGVRDAAPTAALDWQVGVAEGPYCSALNLVRAYARPFGASSGGVEVGLKDNRTNLFEDERIEITTIGPDFPAYLQVDYYSGDGSVTHLRSAASGSPMLPARSTQGFYAGDVVKPFGTDLIVAVASSTPLFAKDRPQSERGSDYLRELRTALNAATQRRAQVAAGAVMVRTNPKR